MIRYALCFAVVTCLLFDQSSAAAAPFVCPTQPGGAEAAKAQEIRSAIPVGDALDDVARLNAAVAVLRQKGLSQAIIIDSFISAYCPVVAQNTSLNDQQKTARVRRFASQIVRAVYALDSEEEVILDVAFRPAVIDIINAKASAERISPEKWVADAIDNYLKSSR